MIDDDKKNQTGQNNSVGQGQADSETERRNRENETGEQSGGQSSSGFVGSSSDDEGDFLTEGAQEFAPDGQGASDSNAGLSDIETGQTNENDNSIEGESDSDY